MSDGYYKDDGYVNIRSGPIASGQGNLGFFGSSFASGVSGSSRKRRKRRLAARRAQEAAHRSALEREHQAREAAAALARREAYQRRYHNHLLELSHARQVASERLEMDVREGLIRQGASPSEVLSNVPGNRHLRQELAAVTALRQQLSAQRAQLLAQADSFYGDNPGSHPEAHYLDRVLAGGEAAHEQWRNAMHAAQQAQALADRIVRIDERAAALALQTAAHETALQAGQESQARYREINARRDIDMQALQGMRQSAREQEVLDQHTLRVGAATLAGPALISGSTEAIRADVLRTALQALREAGAFVKPTADMLRRPSFWTLLAYSPQLGDGELSPEQRRRFAVVLPLPDMGITTTGSPLEPGTTTVLDYRLKAETVKGETAVHVIPTGGAVSPQVPVRAAQWHHDSQAYEIRGDEAIAPRLQVDPSAYTPPVAQLAPALRGVTSLAHLEGAELPAGASTHFSDCILVFPAGSGIAPCYLAFEDLLTGTGVATGAGRGSVNLGQQLANPTSEAIPAKVAASLKWRTFDSTEALAAHAWREFAHQAVQEAPGLSEINRNRLRKGYPPLLARPLWSSTQRTLELRYVHPPQTLTEAYSLDNLKLSAQGGQPLLSNGQPVRTPWHSAHPRYAEQLTGAHTRQRTEATAVLEQEQIRSRQAEEAAYANAAAARWLRAANNFTHVRAGHATIPYLLSPAGEVPLSDVAGATIETSLRSALVALEMAMATDLAVDFLDLVFDAPEGDFPPGIALSLPLEWLAPEALTALDLSELGTSLELPFRVGSVAEYNGASLFVTRTGSEGVGRAVPVVQARQNPDTASWVLIDDAASGRRLTWTPASAPGAEHLGGTALPLVPALVGAYTGSGEPVTTPQLEIYPGLHDWDIDDFIVIYPADSGLPPEYVMFSEAWRRYAPGVVSGSGQAVEGRWLDERVATVGVPVPASVAERMRGRSYSSFDAFRRAFWKEVSKEPALLSGAGHGIYKAVGSGRAPYANRVDRAGRRSKLEIHHIRSISEGGEVYDLDNLIVVSPIAHIKIHQGMQE